MEENIMLEEKDKDLQNRLLLQQQDIVSQWSAVCGLIFGEI